MLLLDDLQNLAVATAVQEQQKLTSDSVRQGARQMIEYARTDPEGVWQIFQDQLTHFCVS